MSFFNFRKKPSKTDGAPEMSAKASAATPAGVSLGYLRQLELSGHGHLRIVVALDWALARAHGGTPNREDRKHYRQQGDTLYIGTGIGTNGGYNSVGGSNNITSISNSVVGNIVQTAGGTVVTGNGNVQGEKAQPFDFVLYCPRLPHIATSGKVAVKADGTGFAEQAVDCRLSGETSFVCHNADAQIVELEITGNSFVEIRGSAKALRLEVTGSGEMDLSACRAETATVDVIGSGRIEVNVSDRLEGSITGSGTVIHVGEPRHKRIDVCGCGRVRQRNPSRNDQ